MGAGESEVLLSLEEVDEIPAPEERADGGRAEKRQIVQARQIAMYLSRQLVSNCSLATIGMEIGGRDHSTIVYYNNDIEAKMKKNPQLKETVDDIIKNIS